MLIKYLKDTHDSRTGDLKDVPDLQANVLIKLGVAENAPEQPEKTVTTAKNSKKGA